MVVDINSSGRDDATGEELSSSNGVVAVVVSRVEGLVVCAVMTTSGRGCTPLDVESSVGDTDSCSGAVCDRVGSEE